MSTYILAPLSIYVNVLSTNSRKELNLSGSYSFVGIVNDRPVYKVSFFHENFFIEKVVITGFSNFYIQRNKKTCNGKEIFIWYYRGSSSFALWQFSLGNDFRDRSEMAWIKFKSQGKNLTIKNYVLCWINH